MAEREGDITYITTERQRSRVQKEVRSIERLLEKGGSNVERLQTRLEQSHRKLELYDGLVSGKIPPPDLRRWMNLPDFLIERRIALGLTQKELAQRLGLQPQQIQRYEATRYGSASMARIQEIAEVLQPYEPGIEVTSALSVLNYPAPVTAEVVMWQQDGLFLDWQKDGWKKSDLNTFAWSTGAEERIGYKRYRALVGGHRFLYDRETDSNLDEFAYLVDQLVPFTKGTRTKLALAIEGMSSLWTRSMRDDWSIAGSSKYWERGLTQKFYREGFAADADFPNRCFWYGALFLAKQFPQFQDRLHDEVATQVILK